MEYRNSDSKTFNDNISATFYANFKFGPISPKHYRQKIIEFGPVTPENYRHHCEIESKFTYYLFIYLFIYLLSYLVT